MNQLIPFSYRIAPAGSLCLLLAGAFVASAGGQVKAGKRPATSEVLQATQAEAAAAITNLFRHDYYHLSLLVIELSPTMTEGGLTNGWLATPAGPQLTDIVKGKKTLPYFAAFHISVESAGSNQCRLGVRTLSSWVHNGKEIGIHGGWAHHAMDVAPLLQEETNLLFQIARELRWIREGATNMASTNAPPQRPGANRYGMYGEEKAEFEAAVKAAEASRSKSAGSNQNARPYLQ